MSTHAEKIKSLLDHCVKLTQNKGTHHKLDVEKLIIEILAGHEITLQNAAKNGQTKAYIFVYSLGAKYEDVSIYDYLFPNNEMIKKLKEYDLDSVFMRIQKYFEVFDVEHKIYEISRAKVQTDDRREIDKISFPEVELSEDQINLFRDGELAGNKYVGAIIVSWKKYIEEQK